MESSERMWRLKAAKKAESRSIPCSVITSRKNLSAPNPQIPCFRPLSATSAQMLNLSASFELWALPSGKAGNFVTKPILPKQHEPMTCPIPRLQQGTCEPSRLPIRSTRLHTSPAGSRVALPLSHEPNQLNLTVSPNRLKFPEIKQPCSEYHTML